MIKLTLYCVVPNYIKRRTSNICPNLSSVTGHDLDVKGTVYLTLGKDNKNFHTRFLIGKHFPYEAIVGANFVKANKLLLDVANLKFVYPKDNKTIIYNIKASQVKENIGNMRV